MQSLEGLDGGNRQSQGAAITTDVEVDFLVVQAGRAFHVAKTGGQLVDKSDVASINFVVNEVNGELEAVANAGFIVIRLLAQQQAVIQRVSTDICAEYLIVNAERFAARNACDIKRAVERIAQGLVINFRRHPEGGRAFDFKEVVTVFNVREPELTGSKLGFHRSGLYTASLHSTGLKITRRTADNRNRVGRYTVFVEYLVSCW